MLHKLLIFLGIFFVATCNLTAQESEFKTYEFSAHSPDVAQLGKYLQYPVEMSTGVPKMEIPLYTIKSGSLELPISLSYHASGIRVDQESSFVGLGWVLNAGGVISRVIKDKPDEDFKGFSNNGNNLPDYNPINDDLPYGIVGNDSEMGGPLDLWYRRDKEPDIYTISASGLSGEFCLNNSLEYVSTDYNPLKYDVDLSQDLIIVTNDKGVVYRFGRSLENEEAFETTRVNISSLDRGNSSNATTDGGLPHDSSWYLTEIISSNRKDTISFKYKSSYYSANKFSSMSRYKLTDNLLNMTDKSGKSFDSEIINFSSTTIHNTRVLDKILFKNGSIDFSTATDRIDVAQVSPQDVRVPRITGFMVKNKTGKQIQKIGLMNNDFFNRTAGYEGLNYMPIASDDIRRKSLKLNGVSFYDENNSFVKNYKFEYDMTPLPPRYTAPQDFWGYYNGSSGSTLIPSSAYNNSVNGKPVYFGKNRDSNFDYMKAGVLNKVVYPTGGYTTYNYEPNYYLKEEQTGGKTKKRKTITLFAINRSSNCPIGYLDGVPANNTLEFEVTQDLDDVSMGDLSIMFSDYNTLPNNYTYMKYKFSDLDNGNTVTFEHSPSGKDARKVINEEIRIFSGHRYRLEALTNGVSGSVLSPCDSPWIESEFSYDYWEPASDPGGINPVQAGGLRVKSIVSYDSDDSVLAKKRYAYGDSGYGVDNVGVGELISDPSKNFYTYPLLYFTRQNMAELKDVLWFTSHSQVGLGFNNGSPVNYNKVVEYTTSIADENVTNGKIEFHYSLTGRNVDHSWANEKRPYNRFIFPSWKKSNLTAKTVFKQLPDLSYVPVRSEQYKYMTIVEDRIKTLKMIEQEPDIYSYINGKYFMFNSQRFYYYNFYVPRGRKVNNIKIVKDYKDVGDSITTTTQYFYDNLVHLQPTATETVDSKGNIIHVNSYYPDDVLDNTSLGAPYLSAENRQSIEKLKFNNLHQVSQPLQIERIVNGERSVQRISYREWSPNTISPESMESLKGYYSTDNIMHNDVVYSRYGDNGIPVEITKAEGAPVNSYIWGYNGEYPIAKIENATYLEIADVLNISISQLNSYDENDMGVINSLRAKLPDAMVTTYTYEPLIGMLSQTDPKGETITYHYDAANRLEFIKDDQGKLLKEYNYKFKLNN